MRSLPKKHNVLEEAILQMIDRGSSPQNRGWVDEDRVVNALDIAEADAFDRAFRHLEDVGEISGRTESTGRQWRIRLPGVK